MADPSLPSRAAAAAAQVGPLEQLRSQRVQVRHWMSQPLEELRDAARGGDAAAQTALAKCFDLGKKELAKSPKDAAEWYRLGAAGGNAEAQFNLGWMSAKGDGVQQERALAVRLYRLSARQGFEPAQYNLGRALSLGVGCDADAAEASQWMRRASDSGFVEAQALLARWLMKGEHGVAIDYVEAMDLASRAAAHENASAMTTIGLLNRHGLGRRQSNDDAYIWFRQAAELGSERAAANLRFLAEEGHAPSVTSLHELGLEPAAANLSPQATRRGSHAPVLQASPPRPLPSHPALPPPSHPPPALPPPPSHPPPPLPPPPSRPAPPGISQRERTFRPSGMEEAFACCICLGTCSNPVTVLCGAHNCCRNCLRVYIQTARGAPNCPLCRGPCQTDSSALVVNVGIADVISSQRALGLLR